MKGNRLIEKALVIVLLLLAMPMQFLWGDIDITQKSESKGKPYKSGSKWYSLHANGERSISTDNMYVPHYFSVYAPCVQKLSFQYKRTWGGVGDCEVKSEDEFGTETLDDISSSSSYQTYTYNLRSCNVSKIIFDRYAGATLSIYFKETKVELAKHIRLKSGTYGTSTYTYDETSESSHAKIGQAKKITIPFRSFYTSGNITVYMSQGNSKVFRLFNSTTNYTSSSRYTLLSNSNSNDLCGIEGGDNGSTYNGGSDGKPGNASLMDIDIWYYPTSTSTETAVFTITDGTSTATATIHAKGEMASLTFGETTVTKTSPSQSFTMTDFLPASGNITVNAPTHFQVSADNSTWSSSINIAGNSTYYVRFAPTSSSLNDKSGYVTMTENCTGKVYTLRVEGTPKKMTMQWVNTSDTIVVGTECQGGFAKCVEDPGRAVYYLVNDTVIQVCDEDANHPGRYLGVQGAYLSAANVTAYILNSDELNDTTCITKPFKVSAKKAQTIIGVNNQIVMVTGSSSVKLNAIAVLGKDGVTPTGKAVSYVIEDAASKSGIVTLSGDTLTPVGKGTATLIISADGDSVYEPTQREVTIEVYNDGECGTQYLYNTNRFTSLNTWKYPITKPAGRISAMNLYLYFATVKLEVYYMRGGVKTNLRSNTQYTRAATDCTIKNVVTEQDIPDDADTIVVKMQGVSGLVRDEYYLTPLILTQEKYLRNTSTTTVNFDSTQYKHTSDLIVPAVEYSALDGIMQCSITGAQASSFTVLNPEILTVQCGDWGTANLNVRFTPQIVGDCDAVLHISALVNGTTITKDVVLHGKGVPQKQTIEWEQDFSYLTMADKNRDTLLTAASSIKSETLPITYTIESLNSDLTPASQTYATLIDILGGTYLHVIGAGKVRVTASQAGKTRNDTTFIAPVSDYKIIDIGAATQSIEWNTWDGENVEFKTIYTSQDTTVTATTLDAKVLDKYNHTTGMPVKYDFKITGNCNNDPLAQLIDTTRDANNNLVVKYRGGGKATLTITASQPGDGNNYAATTVNQTKTLYIEKVTPVTIWTTGEVTDLHYGDSILMTPTTNYGVGLDTYDYTSAAINNNRARLNGNSLNIKAVSTGESITARKAEDCWNYQSTNSVTRSGLTFAQSPQAIVWNDILNDTIAGNYSANPIVINLSAYSVDSRHTTSMDNVDTWLTREANGDVLTGIDVVYTVSFTPKTSGTLSYNLAGNVLTITDAPEGTVTIRANCVGNTYYTAPDEVEKSFEIKKGWLHFLGSVDTLWREPLNWNLGIVPTDINNVSIDARCVVEDNETAACDSMVFTAAGSLKIEPEAALDAGVISNSDATKLLLKADATNQATVMLSGGNPDATIECCFRGTLNPEAGANNPDWQYRGFIGTGATVNSWSNIVMFKWDERTNGSSCWNDGGKKPIYNRSGSYSGETWTGYCMANYGSSGDIHSYTTQLIPTKGASAEHEYYLTRTTSGDGSITAPNCGVNLITNSWSAPIDMYNCLSNFDDGAEATFYLFNTRSHNAYSRDTLGSFVVYPTATGRYTNVAQSQYIPAGQSFLVRTTVHNARLTIGSAALTSDPSGVMYAPRNEEFNVLRIILSTSHGVDRLTLIENENCSSGFDNGYDGTKMMQTSTAQIYAVNPFGNTAVNSDRTMLGQLIGCKAATDGDLCTITFETDMLSGFDELYLFDRTTRIYTDILKGEAYSFNASAEGDGQRFEILGRRDDETEYVSSADRMIEVVGNRALISGFSGSSEPIYITDLSGNRLWSANTKEGPWFEIPMLPAGVYIIYCDNIYTKFVIK